MDEKFVCSSCFSFFFYFINVVAITTTAVVVIALSLETLHPPHRTTPRLLWLDDAHEQKVKLDLYKQKEKQCASNGNEHVS